MPSTTQKLIDSGLMTNAPNFLRSSVHYETIVGSRAYGVERTSGEESSDFDLFGFAIPPKEMIYKHLTDWVPGFGEEPPGFAQWEQHHICDTSAGFRRDWDVQIYSIVKYFELCRLNNPNLIDSLFTPEHCILHCTQIGQMVRENRHKFLSKLCWTRIRGFAILELKRIAEKNTTGNRLEMIKRFGYDVKSAYHIVRLFDEAEQILIDGDLDLQRCRELMTAVRRGDWREDELRLWIAEKQSTLESAYCRSRLPESPPIEPLRRLLVDCLEQHYGAS